MAAPDITRGPAAPEIELRHDFNKDLPPHKRLARGDSSPMEGHGRAAHSPGLMARRITRAEIAGRIAGAPPRPDYQSRSVRRAINIKARRASARLSGSMRGIGAILIGARLRAARLSAAASGEPDCGLADPGIKRGKPAEGGGGG